MTTRRVGDHPVSASINPDGTACRPIPTSRSHHGLPPLPGGSEDGKRRVLMLSWEYPPVLVGGLGRHVHALATSLAAAG
ncbi:glycogen/starch synthase, partial [Micromonospora sp. NPDC049559]|uniref:glycogen/starch synthase n=1 Tax=Micromonospora sp. NPDC049559 TaxID=3155923 RepID=UPI0034327809